MEKIKLYCLPFAGSSAMYYMKWQRSINSKIEIVPVELAGKGSRQFDPAYNNLKEVINDCVNFISADNQGEPYAIYGHSLGGCLAYEIYNKLADKNHPLPTDVFISGQKAPSSPDRSTKYHLLPDQELKDVIYDLGGITDELIAYPEVYEQFLITIRNDLKLLETYSEYETKRKMNCRLTVFHGIDDDEIIGDINDWAMFTTKDFHLYEYNGGHFFIEEYMQSIILIINQQLQHPNYTFAELPTM